MVDVVLYSLAEALSDLQLRHQNHLLSANVVLFRGLSRPLTKRLKLARIP